MELVATVSTQYLLSDTPNGQWFCETFWW